MIRWATVSLLAGLLAIGLLYDRSAPSQIETTVAGQAEVQSPTVQRPGRLTAIWYCPVGSSNAGGFAAHEIAITNTGSETAVANLTVLTAEGPSIELRQEIQPAATSSVDLPSLSSDRVASAVVEIVGGEGLVGHTVRTAHGLASGPCATKSAGEWYFAGGSTTLDAGSFLVLMNPFGEDAVFSVEFQAGDRTRRPTDLKSAVVKGRSARVIDVTEAVAREDMVSIHVDVTSGRLVAERLQTFDGQLGPKGAALTLGVASPQPEWFFPAGRILDGSDHLLVVYNPNEVDADVDVSFMFDQPDDPIAIGLVPIELRVPPKRFEVIDIQGLASSLGLELPLDVGLVLSAADGAGIVAERWQMSPEIDQALIGAGGTAAGVTRPRQSTEAEQDEHEDVPADELEGLESGYLQPDATRGLAISRGTSMLATDWLIPRTVLLSDDGTVLAISSLEGATVEVRLLVGGKIQPPIRATVPPGGRVLVPVGSSTSAAPIMISASAPVAVEVQLVDVDDRLEVVGAVPVVAR